MPRLEVVTPTSHPPDLSQRPGLRAFALEFFLVVGVALWIGAWWPSRPIALGVPAALIFWQGLPTRPPFVARRKDDAV